MGSFIRVIVGGGEIVKSRSTAGGCSVGVPGRDAFEPLVEIKSGGVGVFWGCRYKGATEFIFDLRNASLCRTVVLINILKSVEFPWQQLTVVVELFSRRFI